MKHLKFGLVLSVLCTFFLLPHFNATARGNGYQFRKALHIMSLTGFAHENLAIPSSSGSASGGGTYEQPKIDSTSASTFRTQLNAGFMFPFYTYLGLDFSYEGALDSKADALTFDKHLALGPTLGFGYKGGFLLFTPTLYTGEGTVQFSDSQIGKLKGGFGYHGFNIDAGFLIPIAKHFALGLALGFVNETSKLVLETSVDGSLSSSNTYEVEYTRQKFMPKIVLDVSFGKK